MRIIGQFPCIRDESNGRSRLEKGGTGMGWVAIRSLVHGSGERCGRDGFGGDF